MIWVLGFIFGLCLGSLSKVIADRSLTTKTFFGRSFCTFCKKKLAWYDLIPIVSYASLRGKCRYCHKRLSLEYPLMELLTGLLGAGIFGKLIPSNFLILSWETQLIIALNLLISCIVVVVLISVFLTDFKTGYIPDRITQPSLWLVFILLIISSLFKVYLLFQSLQLSPLGKYLLPPYSNYFYRHALDLSQPLFYGALMALSLGLFFYLLIILTKGRGMGGGDLKLGVFLGLAFGFPDSLVVMMLSFVLGSVFGIGLILFGRKRFGQTLPFGPFMSVAGIICLFWSNEILNWYLHLNSF